MMIDAAGHQKHKPTFKKQLENQGFQNACPFQRAFSQVGSRECYIGSPFLPLFPCLQIANSYSMGGTPSVVSYLEPESYPFIVGWLSIG